jgi:hypothetical protein
VRDQDRRAAYERYGTGVYVSPAGVIHYADYGRTTTYCGLRRPHSSFVHVDDHRSAIGAHVRTCKRCAGTMLRYELSRV